MVNENISSCYPETEIYKQGVCSPYNELCVTLKTHRTFSTFVFLPTHKPTLKKPKELNLPPLKMDLSKIIFKNLLK